MDIINSEGIRIPQHIAIIMDGNGRWAKKRFLPRTAGHIQGARNVEKVCRIADKMGVKYVTLYAFSTENWKRSEDEVSALMKLFDSYLKDGVEKCKRDNVRIRIIGDRTRLSQNLQDEIEYLEEVSKPMTGLNLMVAINYGSRDEIRRAVTRLTKDAIAGKVDPDSIDEAMISSYLDTADIPDPDLLIRTSGEQRLSNYLMWQLAYAEMYFTQTHWPDFDENTLKEAIDFYNSKERRFGKA